MADPGTAPFLPDTDQPSPHSRWNRAARVLWAIVRVCLFRLIPGPLHVLRCAILRAFGADISLRAHVHPSVRIWAPWNLAMSAHACLGPDVRCYNVAPIRLGAHATVSQGVHLCAASHDYTDPKMPVIAAPITIEAGAWVAADAFVAMGVTIGQNAVIGARSVVLEDMPAGMVCVGHPCRPMKRRFPAGCDRAVPPAGEVAP
jgi:putative colanic acid biosynthesis acetyltransferase WcaF